MQKRNPATVHAPVAAYSHQIELSGPLRWLVLSGQLGMRLDGTIPTDPVEQLSVTLDNISLNLKEADMEVSNVVKITIYLVDQIAPEARRAVLENWFGAHRPCSTLLYISALGAPAVKVEVDAWACASDAAR